MAGRKISELTESKVKSGDQLVVYRPSGEGDDANPRVPVSTAGGVHTTINQSGDDSRGIEIAIAEDAEWGLTTEDRRVDPVLPSARLEGTSSSDYLEVEIPDDHVLPSVGNGYELSVVQGVEPVTEVLSSATLDGESDGASLEISVPESTETPENVNEWTAEVVRGVEPIAAVDEVRPSASLTGETSGASLAIEFPAAIDGVVAGNDWDVVVEEGIEPVDAVIASNAFIFLAGTDAGKGVKITFADGHAATSGAAGNGWTIRGALTTGGTASVSVDETNRRITFIYNEDTTGTDSLFHTIADVGGRFVAAAAGRWTVAYIPFDIANLGPHLGTNFPRGASQEVTFAGGVTTTAGVERSPLSAVVDSVNSDLIITAIAADTLSEISSEIQTLNEFNATNLVVTTGASVLNATTYFGGDAGDTVSADFSGGVAGVAAVARGPLTVAVDPAGDSIVITAIAADTLAAIETAIEAVTQDEQGNTISFGSGDVVVTGSSASVLSASTYFPSGGSAGDSVHESFEGGVNPVARTPLAVLFDADNQRIAVTAITADSISALAAVLRGVSYLDSNGDSQTLGATYVDTGGTTTNPLNPTTYFAGDAGDQVDVGFSGGLDAEPLEATFTSSTKTFLVRYDTVADNLGEILAIINTADATAVLIKGTSGAATPESPGFSRIFRGASGSTGGGGGGATEFSGLSDTPSSIGDAGDYVTVNPDGVTLGFSDPPTGGDGGGGSGDGVVTSGATRLGADFDGDVDTDTSRSNGLSVFVRWPSSAGSHGATPRYRLHASDSYAIIVGFNSDALAAGQLRNNSHSLLTWSSAASRWVSWGPALTSAMLTASSPSATDYGMLSPADIDSLIQGKIDGVIDSAPGVLDTLNELAAALGDDADYAATVTGLLAAKAPLASPALTGTPTTPDLTDSSEETEIANKNALDALTLEAGTGTTTETALPASGDGTPSSPVTIADGALSLAKMEDDAQWFRGEWDDSSVAYKKGQFVTRDSLWNANSDLWICLVDHTSGSLRIPGTEGAVNYWALIRIGTNFAPADGTYYTPGMVISQGSSAWICRRATDDEPSQFSPDWFFMPRGGVMVIAPDEGDREYRSRTLVVVDEDVYYCHDSVFFPSIAKADIPGNDSFTLLSSHLITRESAQDKYSLVAGLIDGELLYEAFTAHRTFVHSIPEKARVPSSNKGQVFYLPYTHNQGTKSDVTITIGVGTDFVGYSDGEEIEALGSASPSLGPVAVLYGTGTAASYSLRYVGGINEDLVKNIDTVDIAGTTYALGDLIHRFGLALKEIQGYPTGLSAATVTFNVQFEDDNTWYFNDGATSVDPAGFYLWGDTASAYEFHGQPPTLTSAQAVDGDDTNFGMVSGDLLEEAVDAHAPALTDDQAVDGDDSNFGQTSGAQLEEVVDTHAPALTSAQAVDGNDNNFGQTSGAQLEEVVDTHAPALTDTQAVDDEDKTNFGKVAGAQLRLAIDEHTPELIQRHTTDSPGIQRVSFLPRKDEGAAVYLPYDYTQGDAINIEFTLGNGRVYEDVFGLTDGTMIRGWATGLGPVGPLGAISADYTGDAKDLVAIYGDLESDGSVEIDTVVSDNRHFLERRSQVRLSDGTTTYARALSNMVVQQDGYFFKTILSPVTFASNVTTLEFNVEESDIIHVPDDLNSLLSGNIDIYQDRMYLLASDNVIRVKTLDDLDRPDEDVIVPALSATSRWEGIKVTHDRFYLVSLDTSNTTSSLRAFDRAGTRIATDDFDIATDGTVAGVGLTTDRFIFGFRRAGDQVSILKFNLTGTEQTSEAITISDFNSKDIAVDETNDRIYLLENIATNPTTKVIQIDGTTVSEFDDIGITAERSRLAVNRADQTLFYAVPTTGEIHHVSTAGTLLGTVTWYYNDEATSVDPAGLYRYESDISDYLQVGSLPSAIFYGVGQTSAEFALEDRAQAVFSSNYYRLAFNGNAPDASYYKGDGLPVSILDASEVSSDVDLLTGEAAVADHTVLSVPAGDWTLRLKAAFGQTDNPDFSVWLFRIGSSTDVSPVLTAPGQNRAVANPFSASADLIGTTAELEARVVVAATTQYSIIAGTFEVLGTAARRKMAYSLECIRNV